MKSQSIRVFILFVTLISFNWSDGFTQPVLPAEVPVQYEVSTLGGFSYSLPLVIPPGIKDMAPNLSVTYNSQAGDGIMGVGWTISGLSAIGRTNATIFHDKRTDPVDFGANDIYTLDGIRLIETDNGVFMTEVKNFAKINSYGNAGNGPSYFVVEHANGLVYEYGNSLNSKMLAQGRPDVLSWTVNKIYDLNGNYIEFEYDNNQSKGDYRIKEITYGKNSNSSSLEANTISFTYAPRPDTTVSWLNGSAVVNSHVITKIEIKRDSYILNSYKFTYDTTRALRRTRLVQVQQELPSGNVTPPIKFNWGKEDDSYSTPPFAYSVVDLPFPAVNYDYILGDFNGDGATDIINLAGVTDSADFHLNINDKNGGFYHSSSGNAHFQTGLPPNSNTGKRTLYNKQNMYFDYNGDGMDDMIQIAIVNVGVIRSINLEYYQSDGTELNYHSLIFSHEDTASFWINHSRLLPGDFDGDGKQEILAIIPTGFDLDSPLTATGYNLYLIGENYPTSNGILQSNNLVGAITDGNAQVHIMDYNGDGKDDFCRIAKSQAFPFEVYNIDISYEPTITLANNQGNNLSLLTSSVLPDKNSAIYVGDFNGDGMDDMISWESILGWKIHYSSGGSLGFYNEPLSPVIQGNVSPNGPFYYSQVFHPDHIYIAKDFNGDGRCDFLELGTHSPVPPHYNIFYTYGQNDFIHENGTLPSDFDPFTDGYQIGDFNGDGQIDIFARQSPTEPVILSFHPKEICHLVTSIEHAGERLEIEYRSLAEASSDSTDGDWYGFHSWSVNGYTESVYPYCSRQLPIDVVTGIRNNLSLNKNYYYQTLSLHLTGLGLIGFEKVKVDDHGNKKIIENRFSLFPDWGINGTTSLTQFLISTTVFPMSNPGAPISNIRNTYIDKPGDPSGRVRIIKKMGTIETNYATGLYRDQLVGFKANDGPGSIFYEFGMPDSLYEDVAVHNSYKNTVVKYAYYPGASFFNKNKPILETRTVTYPGKNPYIRTKEYEYNAQGLLTLLKEDPEAKNKSTNLTYDVFGNLSSKNIQADIGGGTIKSFNTQYEFTSDGRFLQREIVYNGLDSFINEFEYNVWGKVSQYTENQLSTIYEYDELNRPIKIIHPNDVVERKEYDWAYSNTTGDNPINPPGGDVPASAFNDYLVITPNLYAAQFYVKSTIDNVSGEMYDFLDFEDRIIRKTYPSFNGTTIYEDNFYDSLGRVKISTAPYVKGGVPVIFYHHYDVMDRIILIEPTEGPSFATTYDVSLNPAFVKTTLTNVQTGQAKITFTDPGGVFTVQEDGTEIDYDLNSNGQPDEIIINNNPQLKTSFTYDEIGRQISITEPNKGTTTIDYNALDQIITQTQPNGITVEYSYNDLGNLLSEVSSAGSYSYTYYPSSSAAAGEIKDKVLTAGTTSSSHYEYDAKGRISKATEVVDVNHIYTTEYSYNSFGQLATKSYPSGFVVQYNYNSYGFFEGIDGPNHKLWKLLGKNQIGQITWSKHFNNNNADVYISERAYDVLGFPTDRKMSYASTSTLFTWDKYEFDQNSGNLTFREDRMRNLREDFSYDILDRLTDVSSNSAVPDLHINYATEGNILKKSNISSSIYDWRYDQYALKTVPDDVSGPNPLSIVRQPNTQEVQYHSFNNRIKKLSEAGNEIFFSYGPVDQRNKVVFNPGLPSEKTRYYATDHEETFENGITTKLDYIYASDQLIAIVHESQGVSTVYYIETDYLGNITHVLNAQGGPSFGIVEERSFDAWGKPRDPATWQYFGSSVPPPNWITDRGFTGHEHIWIDGYDYSVINMNGRLYDPMVGRMFSPDPYVVDKTNAQDFNKYSYARNNPLKYTDPDGEWIHIVVGAVLGGVVNLGMQALKGNVNSFGDGLKAFGIGAVVGGVGAATFGAGLGVLSGAGLSAGVAGTVTAGSGGFLAGAGAGVISGATTGAFLTAGNGLLLEDRDPDKTLGEQILESAIWGGALGGITGGIGNGIAALKHGRSFWTGSRNMSELPKLDPLPQELFLVKTEPHPNDLKSHNLNHVFDEKHELTNFLFEMGGPEKAFRTLHGAFVKEVGRRSSVELGQTFTMGYPKDKLVIIEGWKIVVRGKLVDGYWRISSAWLFKP